MVRKVGSNVTAAGQCEDGEVPVTTSAVEGGIATRLVFVPDRPEAAEIAWPSKDFH
jgi:hypothetical protein